MTSVRDAFDPADPFAVHDPNPPAWPSTGTAANRWYRDLPGFLARLKAFHWGTNTRFKYVQLVVDTRFGHFRLRDRDGVESCVDEIFPPGTPAPPEADLARENERLRTALRDACEHLEQAAMHLRARGEPAGLEYAPTLSRWSDEARRSCLECGDHP